MAPCIAVLISLFMSTTVLAEELFFDCQDRWDSGERTPGVYPIYPNGKPVKVYCNHTPVGTTSQVQRRINDKEDFVRSWDEYKHGFGNPKGNFWAGLDTISYMTHKFPACLIIDMTDRQGKKSRVTLEPFLVKPESTGYQVKVGTRNSKTTLSNDLAFVDGSQFYTWDRLDPNSCIFKHQGAGWWYNISSTGPSCTDALLNGQYASNKPYQGIYWKSWHGTKYSMKQTDMVLQRF